MYKSTTNGYTAFGKNETTKKLLSEKCSQQMGDLMKDESCYKQKLKRLNI